MQLDPTEAEKVAELDEKLRVRDGRDFLLVFLIVLALILSAGALIFGLVRSNRRADSAQTKARTSERQVVRLERKVLPIQRVLLRKDILRVGPRGLLGGRGSVGQRGVAGQLGLPGLRGVAGPFGIPGSAGVDGSAGPDGKDGEPGPQGDTGDTGPQGEQGTQGPGPTDEQVAAAVAAYFAGRTWTCEATADPLDSPNRQTCTLD